MSSMAPCTKYYMDRAVQTGSSEGSLSTDLDDQDDIQTVLGAFGQDAPLDTDLERPLKIPGTAYTDSFLSDPGRRMILSQLGPSRSPLITRRTYKHPQILYGRPLQSSHSDKRIVSLPETSSAPSSNVSLLAGPNSLSTRIVSMSEITRPTKHSLSEPATEGNSSVEYLGISDASCRSSRDGSIRYRMQNFPPSGVPITPSPPSSPESVLIIGNNAHVPSSFLRQKCHSRTCTFSEDDEEWITWATSPPRPIPALHGPLSLPYARCPSGAEGTIIGDSDSPAMIWGLPLNEGHVRNLHSPTSPKAVPPSKLAVSAASSAKSGFKKVPNDSGDAHMQATKGNTDMVQQSFTNCVRDLPEHFSGLSVNGQKQWHDTPIQIHDPSLGNNFHVQHTGKGLGFEPTFSLQNSTNLKSSAPVFVPATQNTQSYYFRTCVDPHATSKANDGPYRLTAWEIAQKYQLEQRQQLGLPTPPNTSTLRSPATFPDSSYLISQQHGHSSFNYPTDRYFDPQLFLEKDYSEDLRQLALGRARMQNFGIGLNENPSNFDSTWTSSTLSPPDLRSFQRSSPIINASRILQQDSAISHLGPIPEDLLSSPSRSQGPPYSAQTRKLLVQPQSIPLARLLQRRLSSVTEEDANLGLNMARPSSNVFSRRTESITGQAHGRIYPSHVGRSATLEVAEPSVTTYSQDIESDTKPIHTRAPQEIGRNKPRKIHTKTAILDSKMIEDRKDKENMTQSGLTAEKANPRKKWRARKSNSSTRHPQIDNE